MNRSFIPFVKGLAPLDWFFVALFVVAIIGTAAGALWSRGSEEEAPPGVHARPPAVKSGVKVPEGPFKPPMDKAAEAQAHIGRYLKAIDEDLDGEETPLNYRRIGNLYAGALDDAEKAIGYYEDVLKIFPDWEGNDKVLVNLATCYHRLGDASMERATYRRMLEFFDEGTREHEYAAEKLDRGF